MGDCKVAKFIQLPKVSPEDDYKPTPFEFHFKCTKFEFYSVLNFIQFLAAKQAIRTNKSYTYAFIP